MNPDKSVFLDYLRQIYDQANEHLREQEHKRDQVITFYAVLISFFITANKTISQNFGGPAIILFLSFGLFLIGMVACLTIASLRGWHSQYLDAIYVLNYVIAHEESYETVTDLKNALQNKITEDQNEAKMKNENDDKNSNFRDTVLKTISSVFSSTEDSMFHGMFVFSLLPLFMFGHSLFYVLSKISFLEQYSSLLVLILWFLFVVGAVLYFEWMHWELKKRIKNARTYKTWILDFDYYSNGRPNNSYYEVKSNQGIISLKQNTAGVVTIPQVGNKLLLIQIGRVDTRKHWEFPRGFVEKEEIIAGEVDYQRAASRELKEELNITADKIMNLQDIGEVEPDSGLIDSSIHVIHVNIEKLENVELQKSEKITAYQLVTRAEIEKMCQDGEIVDGFTLSAITLLNAVDTD